MHMRTDTGGDPDLDRLRLRNTDRIYRLGSVPIGDPTADVSLLFIRCVYVRRKTIRPAWSSGHRPAGRLSNLARPAEPRRTSSLPEQRRRQPAIPHNLLPLTGVLRSRSQPPYIILVATAKFAGLYTRAGSVRGPRLGQYALVRTGF